MKQNAAAWDRVLRAMIGVCLLACAFLAPLSLVVRMVAFGGGGLYLLATAVFGSCLGYRMMGISTCAVKTR